jgi:hypothetical protein
MVACHVVDNDLSYSGSYSVRDYASQLVGHRAFFSSLLSQQIISQSYRKKTSMRLSAKFLVSTAMEGTKLCTQSTGLEMNGVIQKTRKALVTIASRIHAGWLPRAMIRAVLH